MRVQNFFSKDSIVKFIQTHDKEVFANDIDSKPFLMHKLSQLDGAVDVNKNNFNIGELVVDEASNKLIDKYKSSVEFILIVKELLAEMQIDFSFGFREANALNAGGREVLLKVLLINVNVNNDTDLVVVLHTILQRYLTHTNKSEIVVKSINEKTMREVFKEGCYEDAEDSKESIFTSLW